MRLISVNLNKRLGNKTAALFVDDWLRRRACDVVVAQEPWVHSKTDPVSFPSYRDVGGNSSVHAWVSAGLASPSCVLVQENWMQIELGYFVLDNMYFSAYSQSERRNLFEAMTSRRDEVGDRPRLIVGDFNFAPEPEDGMDGEIVSRFNSADERRAFQNLLRSCGLVDMTSSCVCGAREFTIVRKRQNKDISFRCDLAILTDYVQESVRVQYDHSSRTGPTAFTDHSALIIDIPVTLPEADLFSMAPAPESSASDSEEPIQAHKTAMARTEPSKLAKELLETGTLAHFGVRSILDFGCGRGRDVAFYRSSGFDTDGYDPHAPFGWPTLPDRQYDLVTVVFVLNVVQDTWRRLRTLKEAVQRVRAGGLLFVATRSAETIRREVESKNWRPFNDGYISHQGRRTFQKGIDAAELATLAQKLDLAILPARLSLGSDTSYILAQKRSLGSE